MSSNDGQQRTQETVNTTGKLETIGMQKGEGQNRIGQGRPQEQVMCRRVEWGQAASIWKNPGVGRYRGMT